MLAKKVSEQLEDALKKARKKWLFLAKLVSAFFVTLIGIGLYLCALWLDLVYIYFILAGIAVLVTLCFLTINILKKRLLRRAVRELNAERTKGRDDKTAGMM